MNVGQLTEWLSNYSDDAEVTFQASKIWWTPKDIKVRVVEEKEYFYSERNQEA